jgi:hypothetical protein
MKTEFAFASGLLLVASAALLAPWLRSVYHFLRTLRSGA